MQLWKVLSAAVFAITFSIIFLVVSKYRICYLWRGQKVGTMYHLVIRLNKLCVQKLVCPSITGWIHWTVAVKLTSVELGQTCNPFKSVISHNNNKLFQKISFQFYNKIKVVLGISPARNNQIVPWTWTLGLVSLSNFRLESQRTFLITYYIAESRRCVDHRKFG